MTSYPVCKKIALLLVSLHNRTVEGRGRWSIVVWPTWHLAQYLHIFRRFATITGALSSVTTWKQRAVESWKLGRHVGHTRTICRPTTSAVLFRNLAITELKIRRRRVSMTAGGTKITSGQLSCKVSRCSEVVYDVKMLSLSSRLKRE